MKPEKFPPYHILGMTERFKCGPGKVTDTIRAEVRSTNFDGRYWDDPKYPGHGGYYYDGRWKGPAEQLIQHYGLTDNSRVLEIGCGKGYLLYELQCQIPGLSICGIDISDYAIQHAKKEVRPFLQLRDARDLPFQDLSFDLVIALATVYMLDEQGCRQAIREMERVGRRKLIQTVTYRNEAEKQQMQSCDVGSVHKSLNEWEDLYQLLGYTGDRSWFVFVPENGLI
ncbi:MAG: class I SAM-dependent methyltransferase [Chlamydiia bacterium]|nr:class I SAM-dependent methyltransferase [Chlamydiia bacterium]